MRKGVDSCSRGFERFGADAEVYREYQKWVALQKSIRDVKIQNNKIGSM